MASMGTLVLVAGVFYVVGTVTCPHFQVLQPLILLWLLAEHHQKTQGKRMMLSPAFFVIYGYVTLISKQNKDKRKPVMH